MTKSYVERPSERVWKSNTSVVKKNGRGFVIRVPALVETSVDDDDDGKEPSQNCY
jgi:hypothetical protein